MQPVLILAAIPLLLRTAAFAQCQGGREGKLNQNLDSDIQLVAKLSQVKLSSFHVQFTWNSIVVKDSAAL